MDMRRCQLALAEAHVPAYVSLLSVLSSSCLCFATPQKRARSGPKMGSEFNRNPTIRSPASKWNCDNWRRSSLFFCAWLPGCWFQGTCTSIYIYISMYFEIYIYIYTHVYIIYIYIHIHNVYWDIHTHMQLQNRHLGAACHGCTKEHPGHLRRGWAAFAQATGRCCFDRGFDQGHQLRAGANIAAYLGTSHLKRREGLGYGEWWAGGWWELVRWYTFWWKWRWRFSGMLICPNNLKRGEWRKDACENRAVSRSGQNGVVVRPVPSYQDPTWMM